MLVLGYSRKRRKALRLGEGCWMSWGCWGTQRVAPGTAGDILATFPQGFARQECAQQARGQIVTACRKYIYIYIPLYMYLETFLYAAQTVWPKHLIIASPKEQNTSCSRHPPQTASAGATRSTGALSPPSGTPTHHQGGQDTVCHTYSPPQRPVGMGTLTSLRWHHWQIPQRTMVTLRLTVMMAETRRTSREGAPGGGQSRATARRGDRTGTAWACASPCSHWTSWRVLCCFPLLVPSSLPFLFAFLMLYPSPSPSFPNVYAFPIPFLSFHLLHALPLLHPLPFSFLFPNSSSSPTLPLPIFLCHPIPFPLSFPFPFPMPIPSPFFHLLHPLPLSFLLPFPFSFPIPSSSPLPS